MVSKQLDWHYTLFTSSQGMSGLLEYSWFAVYGEDWCVLAIAVVGEVSYELNVATHSCEKYFGIWLHGTMNTFISSLLLYCIHMN